LSSNIAGRQRGAAADYAKDLGGSDLALQIGIAEILRSRYRRQPDRRGWCASQGDWPSAGSEWHHETS